RRDFRHRASELHFACAGARQSLWRGMARHTGRRRISMSAVPEIGGRSPLAVDVGADKTYWWGACGRSKKQPFCDGSHKGTQFTPLEWKAGKAEQAWFCACKRTGNRPLCDGSHKRLTTAPVSDS